MYARSHSCTTQAAKRVITQCQGKSGDATQTLNTTWHPDLLCEHGAPNIGVPAKFARNGDGSYLQRGQVVCLRLSCEGLGRRPPPVASIPPHDDPLLRHGVGP